MVILFALPATDAATQRKFKPNQTNPATGKFMISTPHQSKGRLVRFPGSSLAAAEMGVSRSHLHRVLIGERKSDGLLARWHGWLKRHPQFATLQPRR
jgi:hypothetical protein